MFRALYYCITGALSIIATPFFLLSSRGRSRLAERFGSWNLDDQSIIWFHGASVGEVNGLIPLMRVVHAEHPDSRMLVSATSVTAFERLPSFIKYNRLLPFDSRPWIKRALRNCKIKAFIFSENEIWPGLISHLKKMGVPCFFVNARISDFSWGHYLRFKFAFGPLLNSLSHIAAVNAKSRERFIELGVSEQNLSVAGNSKYDTPPDKLTEGSPNEFRRKFFFDDAAVFILGSLRPGEEKEWFSVIRELLKQGAIFNVVVAPRHLEKVDYFEEQLKNYGLQFKKRSSGELSGASGSRVVLLDTMGELAKTYSFASLVFIGATLVDLGGHNPLEAAIHKAAICTGPHFTKIRDVMGDLKACEAVSIVSSRDDMLAELNLMLNNRQLLQSRGERAFDVARAQLGASARIAEKLIF